MAAIDRFLAAFASYAWGPWLLILLLGGGLFFLFYSRMRPLRYAFHAVDLLRGKHAEEAGSGEISHFQALSSALAGTIGMGNIAGVAVAIQVGGPGAIFWMWVSALLGIVTKFFTCTLAVMYRGKDSRGELQGGPMYVVSEGLGPKWRPLALLFCLAGLIGCLPALNANQLVQVLRDVVFAPMGLVGEDHLMFDLYSGIIIAAIVSIVVIGGISRIGQVTSRLVPAMVLLYSLSAAWVLLTHLDQIPFFVNLIIRDAFTGEAAAGGAFWVVMYTGIRRAAFSNEAGIGTEAMAHGAAKTDEPVREGLVAMLGPFIDTIVVCTATALVILVSGAWQSGDSNGASLTADAFNTVMPGIGSTILVVCVIFFSVSTMFTYSYYGTKCLGFLIGADRKHLYNYFYLALIVVSAVASLDSIINLIDGMYALMAIPTMVSALLLSPRVMEAARTYFAKLE